MNLEISKEYFGELIPFIEDDEITDITWNGKDLWIDDLKKGRYKSDVKLSKQFVNSFATRIANLANKNFNMSSPLLEAETDNLRISIVDNSVTNTDRSIAIRKTPAVRRLNESGMIKEGYAQAMVIKLLEIFVKGHSSIIVTGDVGSGKTELIKYLTKFIPPYERAISIEDNYELRLSSINPDLDCIEIKADTTGQFSYQNAIKAALRQLCKWLLMAEARSSEVVQLLEAASTGCIVMTTMHSDDVRKIPDRVVNMMGIEGEEKRNDVYNFFDVGVKVGIQKTDKGIKRSIDQICVIDRDNDTNTLTVIYDNGFNGEKVPRNVWKKIEEGAGDNQKVLALFDFLRPEDAGTFEVKDTPEFAKMLEEAEEELRLEYTDPFEEIAALGDESLIPIEKFEELKERSLESDPDCIEISEEEISDDTLSQFTDDGLEDTVSNLIDTLFNNDDIIDELRREIQVVEDCMNKGVPIPQEELVKIYKTLGMDENGKKVLNAMPLPKSTQETSEGETSLDKLIAQLDEEDKSKEITEHNDLDNDLQKIIGELAVPAGSVVSENSVSNAKKEIQKILAEENFNNEDELEAEINKMFETRKLGFTHQEEFSQDFDDIQERIDEILSPEYNEIFNNNSSVIDFKNEIDKLFPAENSTLEEVKSPICELNVEDFYLDMDEPTKHLFTDDELDEIFKANEIN